MPLIKKHAITESSMQDIRIIFLCFPTNRVTPFKPCNKDTWLRGKKQNVYNNRTDCKGAVSLN